LERPAIPGEPLRTQVAIRAANISDTEWDYNSSYSVDQLIGENFDNQFPLKGSGVGTVKLLFGILLDLRHNEEDRTPLEHRLLFCLQKV